MLTSRQIDVEKCCIILSFWLTFIFLSILLFQEHSQRGRPEAKIETPVEAAIWGQCLPECSALRGHDYLKCQIDPQSQKFAELHPAEFNELQELYTKIAQLEEEIINSERDVFHWTKYNNLQIRANFGLAFQTMAHSKHFLISLTRLPISKQIGEGKLQLKADTFLKHTGQNQGQRQKFPLKRKF